MDSEISPVGGTLGNAAERLAALSPVKRRLLAARLGQLRGAPAAIPRLAERNHLPLSFAQERLWFLHQFEPQSTAYNTPLAYRLAGPLDVTALQQAVNEIVRRHEILRTTFRVLEGKNIQVIAPTTMVALTIVDFAEMSHEQQKESVQREIEKDFQAHFDLSAGPVFLGKLIRLRTGEHLLLFNFHHAFTDGWSRGVFDRELSTLYADFHLGCAVSLPALPLQYADYAVWQRQWLQGRELERHMEYWRSQLADAPSLELPTDRPRPSQQTFAGARHAFNLSPELSARLKAFNQREGVTPFMTLLAAFQVLLSRYSGQQDILVGTMIANRQRVKLELLIGCFVNTLVMRCDLTGEPDFCEVVSRTRRTALDAYEHQDLPFEKLVEELNPVRDQSRHPLFQVMFTMQNAPEHPLALAGLEVSHFPLPQKTIHIDWEVHFWEREDGWLGEFLFNTNLFDRETIERMACHYLTLLEGALVEPQRPVSQLPMLCEAERHQLLVEWNRTEREYPRDKCIHQLFEEQVERTPDAVAVVFEKNSLTYRELNNQANRLAHQLHSLGVKPGNFVGLRVERSLEMVVALLGILKAGGAYWALEENLPEERFRLMLADAQPRVLLARRKSVKHFSGLAGKTLVDSPTGAITVAAIEDLLESSPRGIIPNTPLNQAGDPAYVSYTSGSTGRPKGVVVPHRGVVRLVKETNYVSLNAEETLLHLSPLSFDASTFEIWGALLNGGRVVLLPPGPPTLAEIGGAIRRHGVTTLWLTAGLFHLMVDERLDDLKPLRQLLAGGDVLSPERVRKARNSLPGCRIINGYGPTENTTFTCSYEVQDERELAPGVPIGRPIANTRVYVLDSHLQPVPVGVAGELFAGGDGVARGYLHQPQLTAERFIPDPFSGKTGARLYRTGDLVRWRPDGNLEFLGRLDSQVKIRGFRIELGEVEAALRAQPEVREATVVVREDMPGDKRLVAYLVAKDKEKPDASILRMRLAKMLPDYMIPNSFAWLDQLPLTASGKMNRKALPAPEAGAGNISNESGQPVSLLELELTRIWRRLFQREDIGRRDNFFALGGHSLMAARMAAEIDKRLGGKLPIAALFQSPTIESLARRLTDENWAPLWSSLVPLQPQGSRPPLFLVHGWGGDVFVFLELAKLLPPDQPTYGVQAVGLDGRSARHITIEEMATHYVREIVSFQPDGPIYLAGFSMGGVIAYEIAQQLHRLGRRVALLALLDSGPTGKTPWFFYGLAMTFYLPERCWFHFRQWLSLPFRERLDYLCGRWAALRYWMVRNRSRPPLITAAPQQTSERLQASLGTDYYHAVAHSYQLRPYPGALDIFVSDESNPAWRFYWRHLARGGVSFHRVSGGHLQILLSQDYMPAMAKSLTTALQSAQEKERAAPSGN
jgi:amino acid adenylation domain-containing protein